MAARKEYRFHLPSHWRRGVFENFEVLPSGLVAPARLAFTPIPEASEECGAIVAFDRCGRLHWLRPHTGELVALYDFGSEVVGALPEAECATELVLGTEIVWILGKHGVRRYVAETLQLLGTVSLQKGEKILSIAGDGCNGLWALIEGKPATLRRYDSFGQQCGKELSLPGASTAKRIAATPDGGQVVVLASGKGPRFEIIVIEAEDLKATTYPFTMGESDPAPDLIAIDSRRRVHVAAKGCPPTKDPAPPIPFLTLSLEGELIARLKLPIPKTWRPLASLAAEEAIAIGGACGIGRVTPDAEADGNDTTDSTFITPTLVSPDGLGNLWNRADSLVQLPEGTSCAVSVAATRSLADIAAIDRLFASAELGPAERFSAVNGRIPWRTQRTTMHAGRQGEASDETLNVLLDALHDESPNKRPATHLWLKLEFKTPGGRRSPSLKRLVISYPEQSLIEHLPEIYRHKPVPAAALRQFLAPVESILDGLHDEIGRLPRNIDPKTAPESWHAFLLRWLGFPTTDGLSRSVRRRLLDNAPALLRGRGTIAALRLVLDILTGGRATVEDSGALPGAWVLPAASHEGSGPRLGRDTLVIDPQSPSLTLGSSSTRLSEAKLNEACFDLIPAVEARNGIVTIRVGAGPAERPTLEPLLWSFIALFVPSQCRVALLFGSPSRWPFGLDGDLLLGGDADTPEDVTRLADERIGRLGSTTDLGCWRLPAAGSSPVLLDRSQTPNGRESLN